VEDRTLITLIGLIYADEIKNQRKSVKSAASAFYYNPDYFHPTT
jgi:hypothetical protein